MIYRHQTMTVAELVGNHIKLLTDEAEECDAAAEKSEKAAAEYRQRAAQLRLHVKTLAAGA
jgi:hypothetical protein